MTLVLSSVHILACVLLIALVLLQQGKGADIGSTLGGDSSSLFGPMTENPLKNITTIVAIIFMGTSVVQAYRARYDTDTDGKLFSKSQQVSVQQPPVASDAAKANTEGVVVNNAKPESKPAVESEKASTAQ